MKQLRANDIEVTAGGGDAGIRLAGKCPICGDTVKVAEYQWWVSVCSCGNKWRFVLSIVADADTPERDARLSQYAADGEVLT